MSLNYRGKIFVNQVFISYTCTPKNKPVKQFAYALVVLNSVLLALMGQGITWQTFRQPHPVTEPILPATYARLRAKDTVSVPVLAPVPENWRTEQLEWLDTERLTTAVGTKSVIFDRTRTRLYAMNLDGMSVCEFDRASRRLLRKLVFAGTPGEGFNYQTKKTFDSFEEKPVEACLTHQDRYLWISLHNAGGVVFWDLAAPATAVALPGRSAQLISFRLDSTGQNRPFAEQDIQLPFIATGKTPKVMAASPDQRRLFVANWHSNKVSVLDIAPQDPARWAKIADLPTTPIPRGLAVAADGRRLFIGQMGGAHIEVISLDSLKPQHRIYTGINPRHLVLRGRQLFASLNLAGRLIQIDTDDLTVVRSVATLPQPRTIALSPDGSLIFVTCYTQNKLQVFRTDDLTLIGTYKTDLHPVGVAIHQTGDEMEAWVGNYAAGNITVLRFRATRHSI